MPEIRELTSLQNSYGKETRTSLDRQKLGNLDETQQGQRGKLRGKVLVTSTSAEGGVQKYLDYRTYLAGGGETQDSRRDRTTL